MPSIFFIFIAIACILLFFVHLAVYKGVVSIFTISSPLVLLGFKIFLIVFGVGFVFSNILASKYNNVFTRFVYITSASWYGFLFYFFLAVALYAIAAAIFGNTAQPATLASLGKGLLVFAAAVSLYGLWNAEELKTTKYEMKMANLPSAWQGKRAVWVSDVHLDQVHEVEYSKKIVSVIEKENPDIVFIGGDLYDGTKVDEDAVIAPFKDLKPRDGIYFITGNHEEFGDKTHFVNAVSKAGIKVLNNEMVKIDGVNIIGVDDHDSTQSSTFENTLSNLNIEKDVPTILLKHRPPELDIAEKFGIAMQISGHTHKAQMYPLSYISKLVYKGYDYGQKQYGSMQVYTSSGIGTWGPPLRVGSKSEILVFDFK